MPLQNRVTPFGEIVRDPARGLFTGNRGCLCDRPRALANRRWRLKAWITCLLAFRGRRRPVMQPRVWTELFFLDEATAFAAGHRPCAYCRRADYNRYRWAWAAAEGRDKPLLATEMDTILHRQRTRRDRSKVTHIANAEGLPDGAMVVLADGRAALRFDGRFWPWSPTGYGRPRALSGPVTVLTPAAHVAVLAAGYQPVFHPSLGNPAN